MQVRPFRYVARTRSCILAFCLGISAGLSIGARLALLIVTQSVSSWLCFCVVWLWSCSGARAPPGLGKGSCFCSLVVVIGVSVALSSVLIVVIAVGGASVLL